MAARPRNVPRREHGPRARRLKRAFAVVNRGAGKRPTTEDLRALLAPIERTGMQVEIHEVGYDEIAPLAQRAVRDRIDAVIAVGGDGTTQTIARELLDSEVVLGILPFGTYMNIAKGLRIPLDAAQAAHVIARGHVRRADVGEVNGQVFFESAGIGLDAEVFGAARAARRGRWAGVWRRVVRWATHDTHLLRVHGEHSQVQYKAMQAIVLNSPFYTWSFPIVSHGDMHDGLLEIAVFPRMGRFALLTSLLRLATAGEHVSAPIVVRENVAHISSDAPLAIQADTRAAGTLPATFRCRAAAFAVFVDPAHSRQ